MGKLVKNIFLDVRLAILFVCYCCTFEWKFIRTHIDLLNSNNKLIMHILNIYQWKYDPVAWLIVEYGHLAYPGCTIPFFVKGIIVKIDCWRDCIKWYKPFWVFWNPICHFQTECIHLNISIWPISSTKLTSHLYWV